ncbi:hypothetical protein THAOC_26620 [Thalassiosira oceanica]|uniref:Uncharacterized protein n=1 Tax=Thalassiosira oceanica TaxID=159749 RepID=K0RYC7_THAOC|nr:hypothetical protein THAOC_26620 [Thalassiosira oceanica]|eukprot:EJK53861.1 hypothetical protein THAOC_26620 [Thalassiosira oceanica]
MVDNATTPQEKKDVAFDPQLLGNPLVNILVPSDVGGGAGRSFPFSPEPTSTRTVHSTNLQAATGVPSALRRWSMTPTRHIEPDSSRGQARVDAINADAEDAEDETEEEKTFTRVIVVPLRLASVLRARRSWPAHEALAACNNEVNIHGLQDDPLHANCLQHIFACMVGTAENPSELCATEELEFFAPSGGLCRHVCAGMSQYINARGIAPRPEEAAPAPATRAGGAPEPARVEARTPVTPRDQLEKKMAEKPYHYREVMSAIKAAVDECPGEPVQLVTRGEDPSSCLTPAFARKYKEGTLASGDDMNWSTALFLGLFMVPPEGDDSRQDTLHDLMRHLSSPTVNLAAENRLARALGEGRTLSGSPADLMMGGERLVKVCRGLLIPGHPVLAEAIRLLQTFQEYFGALGGRLTPATCARALKANIMDLRHWQSGIRCGRTATLDWSGPWIALATDRPQHLPVLPASLERVLARSANSHVRPGQPQPRCPGSSVTTRAPVEAARLAVAVPEEAATRAAILAMSRRHVGKT